MTSTKQQLIMSFQVIQVIAEAIRDLGSVPSGHLYAQVMGKLSLESYNNVIEALVKAEVVKKDDCHMLTWIGPPKK